MTPSFLQTAADRRALLALWTIPGVGRRVLERLGQRIPGGLGYLLPLRPAAWPVDWASELEGSRRAREELARAPRLEVVANQVEQRVRRAEMGVAYLGEPGYPELLAQAADAPPVLFFYGGPAGSGAGADSASRAAPRKRIAMVGSRHPEGGFLTEARALAREVAAAGVGVVSGGAEGVDRACHAGALDARGETWVFLGSALDALDGAQARLVPAVLEGGGRVFSELPPGTHASRTTFPRRNRLISGASDAVWVLRAGLQSGTFHTVVAAEKQGRRLLALPGAETNPAAAGGNLLLREGRAQACATARDACAAVGASGSGAQETLELGGSSSAPGRSGSCAPTAPAGAPRMRGPVSARARAAYALLEEEPVSLDAMLAQSPLGPGELVSALSELELNGWAVQRPGKRYAKI